MPNAKSCTKTARARMHGLYYMRDKLTGLTDRAIDPDSPIGQEMAAWKAAIVEHLGGEESVNDVQRELIDLAATERLMLHSVDAYIAELGTGVINRRHRTLYPIVEARGKQADRYARRLEVLGLDRKERRVLPVTDYLEAKKR